MAILLRHFRQKYFGLSVDTYILWPYEQCTNPLNRCTGGLSGSQTKDDETQVVFKDLEYKTEAANKFSIGNLIGAPAAINYVALHPSRAGQLTEKQQLRLAEGLANLFVAIQTATGQTPVPVTPPSAP